MTFVLLVTLLTLFGERVEVRPVVGEVGEPVRSCVDRLRRRLVEDVGWYSDVTSSSSPPEPVDEAAPGLVEPRPSSRGSPTWMVSVGSLYGTAPAGLT